ncbi:hypothetical protein ID866_11278 [Astraeus odoratus]|nr:hypothetical protein ID866_11278 [Astraeus odoratus]
MWSLHEELAALRQPICDENFSATIMSSLPPSYDSNISAMTMSAEITGTDLTPDHIMKSITDDYDQ